MEINKEAQSAFSVSSYNEFSITIKGESYTTSTIVSNTNIMPNWQIKSLSDLNAENIQDLLASKPELIIIGHNQPDTLIPPTIQTYLSTQRIGIESMSVGAACRTFNILLGENRDVVFAYIP